MYARSGAVPEVRATAQAGSQQVLPMHGLNISGGNFMCIFTHYRKLKLYSWFLKRFGKTRGLWATLLTWEIVPSNKQIFAKLWLYSILIKRKKTFIQTNLNSIYLRMPFAKFVWNWPSGAGEDENEWRINFDQKSLLEPSTQMSWKGSIWMSSVLHNDLRFS